MYFCTVNVNSSLVICMLSSAHWQLASKLSALEHFELIGKIEINAPVNLIIKKDHLSAPLSIFHLLCLYHVLSFTCCVFTDLPTPKQR